MHRGKKRGKKREEEKEKNSLKPESYILKIIYYVYRFYTFLIIILQIFTVVHCVKIILDFRKNMEKIKKNYHLKRILILSICIMNINFNKYIN